MGKLTCSRETTSAARAPRAPQPALAPGVGHPVLQLQQAIGNDAVTGLIQGRSGMSIARSPHTGGVVLRRKCGCAGAPASAGPCEECEKKASMKLQRRGDGPPAAAVPPIVHEVLRSSGHPLDERTRAAAESYLGIDLGDVRIHDGATAHGSATAVHALAYTVGSNIVLGAGQYAPGTAAGDRLLFHEIAHVAQQRGQASTATSPASLRIGDSQDPAEREADRVADRILSRAVTGAEREGTGGPDRRSSAAVSDPSRAAPAPQAHVAMLRRQDATAIKTTSPPLVNDPKLELMSLQLCDKGIGKPSYCAELRQRLQAKFPGLPAETPAREPPVDRIKNPPRLRLQSGLGLDPRVVIRVLRYCMPPKPELPPSICEDIRAQYRPLTTSPVVPPGRALPSPTIVPSPPSFIDRGPVRLPGSRALTLQPPTGQSSARAADDEDLLDVTYLAALGYDIGNETPVRVQQVGVQFGHLSLTRPFAKDDWWSLSPIARWQILSQPGGAAQLVLASGGPYGGSFATQVSANAVNFQFGSKERPRVEAAAQVALGRTWFFLPLEPEPRPPNAATQLGLGAQVLVRIGPRTSILMSSGANYDVNSKEWSWAPTILGIYLETEEQWKKE